MEDIKEINDTDIEYSIKEDRKWCVYIHMNVHNDKRYIGQTCNQPKDRWGKNGSEYLAKHEDGTYMHPVFAPALLKYPDWDNDWEHIIYANNLTHDEANEIEIELIKFYKTNVCEYKSDANGYNCTSGGQGVNNWIPSDETRKKMSDAAKQRLKNPENHPMFGTHRCGEDNPFYGKKHSVETKNKISKANKERFSKENNPMFGKHHTEETRKKMSEHHADFKGKNHPRYGHSEQYSGIHSGVAKQVYCIELGTIFVTISEAIKTIGVKNISQCVRKIEKSAGKHPETGEPLHWLYVEEAIEQGYITQEELDDYLNGLREKEKETK